MPLHQPPNSALTNCPSLLPLRNGSAPCLFLAHGLGGSVLEFAELAKHIQTNKGICGLQAKGMEGSDTPLERIEDMARFHVQAIRKVQPYGPYFLAGFSLGALVVLEMARYLKESGEKIALLAMIDGYPHPRYLRLWQRAMLASRRLKHHATIMKSLAPGEAFSHLGRTVKRFRRNSNGGYEAPGGVEPIEKTEAVVFKRVRDSAVRALANYRPKFYPGQIKFVRAAIPSDFPADSVAVWADLCADFSVETMPGNHQEMLKMHFTSLANILSRYLREAAQE